MSKKLSVTIHPIVVISEMHKLITTLLSELGVNLFQVITRNFTGPTHQYVHEIKTFLKESLQEPYSFRNLTKTEKAFTDFWAKVMVLMLPHKEHEDDVIGTVQAKFLGPSIASGLEALKAYEDVFETDTDFVWFVTTFYKAFIQQSSEIVRLYLDESEHLEEAIHAGFVKFVELADERHPKSNFKELTSSQYSQLLYRLLLVSVIHKSLQTGIATHIENKLAETVETLNLSEGLTVKLLVESNHRGCSLLDSLPDNVTVHFG